MQNSPQRFPGTSVAGGNYSEHSYPNHRESHCQPGYQAYSSPYHSPRQHYANHHQQMPPYRQHYPPQPQYTVGPQEVYRYPHNRPHQGYRQSWPNYPPKNGMPAYPAAESQPAYSMENGMPPAYLSEAGPLHSLQKMVMPKDEFFPVENGEPTYFNLDENRLTSDAPFFPPDTGHPPNDFHDRQHESERANSGWTPNALSDPPLVQAAEQPPRPPIPVLPAATDSEHMAHPLDSEHMAHPLDSEHVAHPLDSEHVAHPLDSEHVAHPLDSEHVAHPLDSEHVAHPLDSEHVAHPLDSEHMAHPLETNSVVESPHDWPNPPLGLLDRSPKGNEASDQRIVTEKQSPLRDCEPDMCSSATPSPCSLFPGEAQNSESRVEDGIVKECESGGEEKMSIQKDTLPPPERDPELSADPVGSLTQCDLPSLEDISRTPVKVMLHRIRKHDSGTWHIPEDGCTEDECSPRKVRRRASRGRGSRRRGSSRLRRCSPIRVTKNREKRSGPFVRRTSGGGASFVVVNGTTQHQPEERRRPRATPQVGHSSTLSPTYDAFNKDKTWLCVFCRRGSHVQGLGDLYGPYFVRDARRRRRRKKAEPPSDAHTGRELWLHEDCAVWSGSVTLLGEEVRGLREAAEDAAHNACCGCGAGGATLGCWAKGCGSLFHFCCARQSGCQMNAENFSLLCKKHQVKARKG